MALSLTQRLADRYVIVSKLGEGGMGAVYRAVDERLDKDVVIKIPHAEMANLEFLARFHREIRSLVTLAHPHVVTITDVGEHDGVPFAVMAFLEGGSLDDRRPRDADDRVLPVDVASIGDWLLPIAQALDFVHRQGYIHRDIKPANILFDRLGHPFLGDFGIVKVVMAGETRDGTQHTKTGFVVGTADYMAPELVMGEPFDGRVDQYALAVAVHELLTGRPPFSGTQPAATLVNQVQLIAPPLRDVNPLVPAAMSAAVERALSKKPADRYPTCVAFAEAALAHEYEPPATVAPAASTKTTTGNRQRTVCPACNHFLALQEKHAGHRIRCPQCQVRLQVSDDNQTVTIFGDASSGGANAETKETYQLTAAALPAVAPTAPSPAPSPTENMPAKPVREKKRREKAAPEPTKPARMVLMASVGVTVMTLLGFGLAGRRSPSPPAPESPAPLSVIAAPAVETVPEVAVPPESLALPSIEGTQSRWDQVFRELETEASQIGRIGMGTYALGQANTLYSRLAELRQEIRILIDDPPMAPDAPEGKASLQKRLDHLATQVATELLKTPPSQMANAMRNRVTMYQPLIRGMLPHGATNDSFVSALAALVIKHQEAALMADFKDQTPRFSSAARSAMLKEFAAKPWPEATSLLEAVLSDASAWQQAPTTVLKPIIESYADLPTALVESILTEMYKKGQAEADYVADSFLGEDYVTVSRECDRRVKEAYRIVREIDALFRQAKPLPLSQNVAIELDRTAILALPERNPEAWGREGTSANLTEALAARLDAVGKRWPWLAPTMKKKLDLLSQQREGFILCGQMIELYEHVFGNLAATKRQLGNRLSRKFLIAEEDRNAYTAAAPRVEKLLRASKESP